MRPLRLEMTAFGSYSEKTVLPFDTLRHGLYLVTGDTGAGKTTIFDAIVFALYGKASGKERSADMLHCDHVSKETDTEVMLRFTQGGKEYAVRRTMHFPKKRGAVGFNDAKFTAELIEPGAKATEGHEKVTARIEALLGLNADQFRQIIMLAQGEFREFLRADSDRKNAILGKLFDSAPYLAYQNLLLDARERLKNRRESETQSLKSLMEQLFLAPKELTDEQREALHPGHPALLDTLRELIEEESDALGELTQERERLREQINNLNEQKGAAAEINARFDELDAQRQRKLELEAQEETMRVRGEALRRAELAYRRVKPAVTAFEQASARLDATLTDIETGEAVLERYGEAETRARDAVEADGTRKQTLNTLAAEIREIDGQLPKYREYAMGKEELSRAQERARQTSERLEQQREALEAAESRARTLREQLESLEGAEAALREREQESEKVAERLEKLRGKNGLRARVRLLTRGEEELAGEKRQLMSAGESAAAALVHYTEAYRRFLAAQAGLLAGELSRTLDESGEASCPVCGTRLCREHRGQLAPLPADTPNQESVEALRLESEGARQRHSELSAAVERHTATLEEKKQSLLEQARELLPGCEGWEQLRETSCLDGAIRRAEDEDKAAQTALRRAEERVQKRDRVRRERDACNEEQERLRKLLDEGREALNKETEQTARLSSAQEERKKQLRFADEAAARAMRREKEANRTTLERTLAEHEEALRKASALVENARGSLEEKRGSVKRLTDEQERACAAMETALRENAFTDPAAVDRALAVMRGMDGESWLEQERSALQAFKDARLRVGESIERLSAQTLGRERSDLGKLEETIDERSDALQRCADACGDREALLQNHRRVLERANSAIRELESTEKAWQRLDRLASLAGGENADGGKLSFDRYVMGAVFREILEMANRRMELMSGGRYELVHKTGAERRNAKAGLEIEVLDHNTSQQRPSASLSGGEAFFTSLSLALGLSDVVQNHAGGRQMEALFIDEGFGSLSDDVLDKALDVLGQLTEGNRLVGVISHVDRLDESIPQKIRVRAGEKGSSLSLEIP